MENLITNFVAEVVKRSSTYYAEHYPNLDVPEYRAERAKRYVKVWEFRYGRKSSIHAFIDPVSGDIYMPAGCNAPALKSGARGNLNSETNGAEALMLCGRVRYAGSYSG